MGLNGRRGHTGLGILRIRTYFGLVRQGSAARFDFMVGRMSVGVSR